MMRLTTDYGAGYRVSFVPSPLGAVARSRSGPAHTVRECRCGIIISRINVEVRTEIFGKLFPCPLHVQARQYEIPYAGQTEYPGAAEPADTLHRHQIAPAQANIARSVVGSDARAEERSGFRQNSVHQEW